MKFEYHPDADETTASIDNNTFATMNGKVTQWRNGIPHPDTEWFGTFEIAILQLDTPTERKVILHIITGNSNQVGFGPDSS